MTRTEDDTFETLRRWPMDDSLLDIVEPEFDCGMDVFIENMNSGAYDDKITQCGWTRESFNKAYYEKYVHC
jgi:hypothetical protein